MRGSSEPTESWKMICMSRRFAFSSRRERCVRSVPSKKTWPPVGSISRRIVRPSVDLPQPDSPTSPSVSPRRTARSTPSTAWTCATVLRQQALLDREVLLDARAPRPGCRSAGAVRPCAHCSRNRRSGRGLARPCSQSQHADSWSPSRVERRQLLEAAVEGVVAARREAAALRPVERARHVAADHAQRLGLRHPEHRDRLEQRLGVRVLRRAEDVLDRPALDDPAAVHDGHRRRRSPRRRRGRA